MHAEAAYLSRLCPGSASGWAFRQRTDHPAEVHSPLQICQKLMEQMPLQVAWVQRQCHRLRRRMQPLHRQEGRICGCMVSEDSMEVSSAPASLVDGHCLLQACNGRRAACQPVCDINRTSFSRNPPLPFLICSCRAAFILQRSVSCAAAPVGVRSIADSTAALDVSGAVRVAEAMHA